MIGKTSSPVDTVLRNKELAQTIWMKILNGGEVDLIAGMMAPNYTYNGQPSPADATAGWLKSLRESAPDTYFRIEGLIGAHDTVALRWTLTGTTDGKRMILTGENILTFDPDGLLVSNWQSMGTPDFAHIE